ncbi:LysR family transcriptional regulator [Paenibacillus glycanilyticus]|uniref:LysR family transcriptional regulator n=1 Tax=Paenibacillus glycanilyticus TaxID=126569 RepID=UPI0019107039|nr:LysR family transcriptional regulator [Paenibacillus glycanilyticus]
MDISQLEAFLSICHTLNFTKSSEHLHISQSAITARIKTLEASIGKNLFVRDNRNVSLTQAGISFLPYAERMLRLFEESKYGISEQYANHISFGGPGPIWQNRYLDNIIAFRETHPEVAVKFFTYLENDYMVRNLLLDGSIHIAVRYEPPEHPRVTNIPLFEDEILLVSAEKGLKVSKDDLSTTQYCHVGFKDPKWFTDLVGPSYVPSLQLDHAGLIINLLLRGGIFAFSTRTMLQPFLDEKKLFVVENDFPIPRFVAYVSYLTENEEHPSVKLALSMLSDSTQN